MTVQVPNLVGLDTTTATAVLAGYGLVLGTTSQVYSSTVTTGLIVSTSPIAGTNVAAGSAVNIVLSQGPQPGLVPNIVGLTQAQAQIALATVGLTTGSVTPELSDSIQPGSISSQHPTPGTLLAVGSAVNVGLSVFDLPFDYNKTIISQYANSPTLLRLISNMLAYIDPRANFQAFYQFVWNVDTAVGFGLDIWGKIVGVSRLIQLSSNIKTFGYQNADVPPDWQPFGQGTFTSGAASAQAYLLPDDAYRTLILAKALANISATTAPALNQLLRNLFPGRGRCYVIDSGAMTMHFVFEFALSNVEFAILSQSGALPHPAGVGYNVIVIPPAQYFGFAEQGSAVLPWGSGVYYLPPQV
jgi:hypothetical protein